MLVIVFLESYKGGGLLHKVREFVHTKDTLPYLLFPDRAGFAGVRAGDGAGGVAEYTRHSRHEPFTWTKLHHQK